MKQHEKGRALLQMIAILGILKEWCYRDKSGRRMVLVCNQPESFMGLEKGAVRNPFGDKAIYATKEIYEIVKEKSEPELTVSSLKAFRSRKFGYGKKLARIIVTPSESSGGYVGKVDIEWLV